MFEVGFWELSVIAVVALLVVGPHRLPALARTVGLYVGKFRRYADHVRREIEREVNASEMKAALEKPALSKEIGGAVKETKEALSAAQDELKELDSPALPEAGQSTTGAGGKTREAGEEATALGEKAAEPREGSAGGATAAGGESTQEAPVRDPSPTPVLEAQEEDGRKGP